MRALAALLLPALCHCAITLSAAAAPTFDTRATPGGEGRLALEGAFGSPELRMYGSVAGGGGYLAGSRAAEALVSPELGLVLGQQPAVTFGGLYTARFLIGQGVAHGGGGQVGVAWPVKATGGEHGYLALGFRASAEGVALPDGSAIGLFQLGLLVRWTTFDTTANRMSD
jgi:hypothetical protein